ncbi:unnamed protein product [Natator depressus]
MGSPWALHSLIRCLPETSSWNLVNIFAFIISSHSTKKWGQRSRCQSCKPLLPALGAQEQARRVRESTGHLGCCFKRFEVGGPETTTKATFPLQPQKWLLCDFSRSLGFAGPSPLPRFWPFLAVHCKLQQQVPGAWRFLPALSPAPQSRGDRCEELATGTNR